MLLRWTVGRSQPCVYRYQHLPLYRKPNKKVITTFAQWVMCLPVYPTTLCAYQTPDMLSYLYIIASSYQEFHFTACLAHNVAFRRKATNFRLTSWDHIDPQSYSD